MADPTVLLVPLVEAHKDLLPYDTATIIHDVEEVLWKEDPEEGCSTWNIPEVHGIPVSHDYDTTSMTSTTTCAHSRRLDNTLPPSVEAFPLSMRAEFLYASALLPPSSPHSRGNAAGIHLQARANFGVAIQRFEDDSPLRGSSIRAGDHIVAINNISCADADLARIEKLIASSSGRVISICVHNKNGDPHLVSSSVQKPNAASKVGITMKTKRGVVYFNQVYRDGLFGKSLLMPHHRCMVINGMSCRHMNAESVAEIIASANDRVTIVSKPQMYYRQEEDPYAITLALCEHQKWWKNVMFGAGVAVGAVATIGSLG